MRESTSPIAIAQSVDTGHIGAELIIHLDVATLIDGDARIFQAEVIGVRHPAYCKKRMRTDDCLIAAGAIEIDGHLLGAFLHGDAFSAQSDVDAFVLEDCPDGFGNVFVFTLNQARPHLHDRDLTAKSAVHLSKLQTNIAAANDDQMLGQKVHFHHS